MKELDKDELQVVEGGMFQWIIAIAVGAAIGAINEIYKDWDNFERGIKGEPYQKK